MLRFDGDQQRALVTALGVALDNGAVGRARFLLGLKDRFPDYFSLKAFAENQGLNPVKTIDFNP